MIMKEKLVSLRKEKNLTQMELAEELLVSRQAVSRWESGLAVPSTDNLKFLSGLYHVPVDVLLNDELDIPKEEENISAEAISTNTGKAKRGLSKKVIVVLCAFLVVVILLIYIVKIYPKQDMGATSIGTMQQDVIDPSAEESFDIDW